MPGRHRRSDDGEEISPAMTEAALQLKKARILAEIEADRKEFPPKRGILKENDT